MFVFFRTILVIVQASTTASKRPNEYQIKELYNGGSSGPYVTAVLSSSDVKGTFVIGNGESYSSGISPVVNRPLKEKTDYIIFLRYIENEVNSLFPYKYLPSHFIRTSRSEI